MTQPTTGANLGFENKLWNTADRLRGHMDAAEYEHVVLGRRPTPASKACCPRTTPGPPSQPITPLDAPTPIVSFLPADLEETRAKLARAFAHQIVSFREWYCTNERGERIMVPGMRLGVSVYNNHEDIDKFLDALAIWEVG